MIGDGVQILGMADATIIFATLVHVSSLKRNASYWDDCSISFPWYCKWVCQCSVLEDYLNDRDQCPG
jgi:hypothetical protein